MVVSLNETIKVTTEIDKRGVCKQYRLAGVAKQEYSLFMTQVSQQKQKDTLVRNVERRYGVELGYKSDAELHKSLRERGLPTLSRLLKKTQFAE